MTTPEDLPEDDTQNSQDAKNQKKIAKHNSGAADLEKVTDYEEEKELSGDITGALSVIGDRRNKEAAEKQAKERELAKVVIRKEDVELIMKELEISKQKAELTLREHRGNVVNALIELTN